MSWVQLNGETWPVTPDGAQLEFYVQAQDVGCPRVQWRLDLTQRVEAAEPLPNQPNCESLLAVEITDMPLPGCDWRELANLEIRADTAWQATNEFIGPYGHSHNLPKVDANHMVFPAHAKSPDNTGCHYLAHDFILRFGQRDGLVLPCEIDAWVIPINEYYRTLPETPAEAAKFSDGPPNLRIITRAQFIGGSLDMVRCGTDPLPSARQQVRELLGCEEFFRPTYGWWLRSNPAHKEILPMKPGWRSTVHFFTTETE
jgi:hypothetical protein